MVKTVGVKLNSFPKIYDYLPSNLDLKIGDIVIVEGPLEAIEPGRVVYINKEIKDEDSLKKILRKATEKDLKYIRKLQENTPRFLEKYKKLIEKHQLPMRPAGCIISLDGKKIIFYFTSETRVDFRNLVNDLAKEFKMQIRLQQIGFRDETRYFPYYYGICGQPVCCGRFLKDFENINIEMARLQDLASLGTSKITGVCGRLMCCLKYEASEYKKLLSKMPKLESFISTPKGKGKVIGVNIIKEEIKVEMEDNSIQVFPFSEIKKK